MAAAVSRVTGMTAQCFGDTLPGSTMSCSGDAGIGSLAMQMATARGPGTKGVSVAVARRPLLSSATGTGTLWPIESVATTEMASAPVNMRRVLSTPLA